MSLYVVGIGPGDIEDMTLRAYRTVRDCDVIVGYTAYVELLRGAFPEKPVLATGMRGEVERCRTALAEAQAGREVALVCSGDAGVYGMAGPVLELAGEYPGVDVRIVPGVSAAMSGAALLGAPLMHDFAVVSLSDLLTPWDSIEARLAAAAGADFALCLYNPGSHKRAGYLARAAEVLLRSRSAETVCGIARNIGREGETFQVTTLGALREARADMSMTVFVGNSRTRLSSDGRMVTPRGYRLQGEA